MLTPEQIAALTAAGANRWQHGQMDRLYIKVSSLGFQMRREYDEDTPAFLGYLNGEQVAPAYIVDILKNTKVWVDVNTAQIGVKPGSASLAANQRDQLSENAYLSTLRQNAEMFVNAAYEKAEQEAADQRMKSISAAALKWRKGTLINLEGRTYQVTRIDNLDSPLMDKATMNTRVRLVVMLHDGRYRRVDLDEVSQDRY